MADASSLAELVAQARADQGMSLRDVERASGGLVGHNSVALIETGRRAQPGPKTLAGLSQALNLPLTSCGPPPAAPLASPGSRSYSQTGRASSPPSSAGSS